MKLEVQIDAACTEDKVIVQARQMTAEVQKVLERLSEEEAPQAISGFCNNEVRLLPQEEIIRVYANNGKVFAQTQQGEFALRLRLYEAESRLNPKEFVRISNAEVIHLKWVKSFDMSLSGTICVRFDNGTTTYVSRRYVQKIKQILGL